MADLTGEMRYQIYTFKYIHNVNIHYVPVILKLAMNEPLIHAFISNNRPKNVFN